MGINVEILTPLKKYEKEAKMVILPGVEGDLGVLTGHTHLITCLKPNKLQIIGKNFHEYYKVGFGLIKVTPQEVTIITENFYKEEFGESEAN